MVQKIEQALPPETSARVPAAAETAAAKFLAVGYGLTAGMLYTMLHPDADHGLADGTALGLGTWVAGYVGWLPALDLMPPLTEQRLKQTVGPVIHHILFGMAAVAVYRWLKNPYSRKAQEYCLWSVMSRLGRLAVLGRKPPETLMLASRSPTIPHTICLQ